MAQKIKHLSVKMLRTLLSRWRRLITGMGALFIFSLILAQIAQGFAAYRATQVQYAYFAEAFAPGTIPYNFVRWYDVDGGWARPLAPMTPWPWANGSARDGGCFLWPYNLGKPAP